MSVELALKTFLTLWISATSICLLALTTIDKPSKVFFRILSLASIPAVGMIVTGLYIIWNL